MGDEARVAIQVVHAMAGVLSHPMATRTCCRLGTTCSSAECEIMKQHSGEFEIRVR
jgi:hypothetical protein